MHLHGPVCLEGPISRERGWWNGPAHSPPASHPARSATERVAAMNDFPTPPSPADSAIRIDLVERIRQEIADGIYETPEKWDTALDRLLKRLEEE
jgi:hypothetical protein